jgi:hypothetical protein
MMVLRESATALIVTICAASLGVSQARAEASADASPAPAVEVSPAATYREPLQPTVLPRSAPARRIANLSPGQCLAELRKRKLDVRRIKSMGGIASPLRLGPSIGDVRVYAPGRKSIYGILDCRLALALDELAKVLAAEGVTELHVDNFYRPRAHLPGKKSKRSQHAYGMAVDVQALKTKDGRLLVVERDFRGQLSQPVCGENAQISEADTASILLRNVVCAVVRAGIFHDILTPNYDAAHHDHLHLDIRRGADYYTLR